MKMDKQQAKHILKNTGYIGNEVGVAFDVAIKSMDKLEKIEQIIEQYQFYKALHKSYPFSCLSIYNNF